MYHRDSGRWALCHSSPWVPLIILFPLQIKKKFGEFYILHTLDQ